MDLAFNEEQEILRRIARDFLERECPRTLVREMEASGGTVPSGLWRKMAELGWVGLPLPEAYGGGAATFMELAILAEEMGRALLPGPFLSHVTAAIAINQFGRAETKDAVLPAAASGQRVLTYAVVEASGDWGPEGIRCEAQPAGDGFVLRGEKRFVRDVSAADVLLVAARTSSGGEDGITVFLVDRTAAGLSAVPVPTIGGDNQAHVALADVRVAASAVLGEVDRGWPVVDHLQQVGAVLQSLYVAGACKAALEMTVEYAKSRVQFGRPIGAFQAIQHHCANMVTDADITWLLAYQAAWRIAEGLDARAEVAAAKAAANERSRRLMALAHQVHGGNGVIKEHDIHLFSKRARALEPYLGGTPLQHERLLQTLGL